MFDILSQIDKLSYIVGFTAGLIIGILGVLLGCFAAIKEINKKWGK